ncbi:MAG: hypothetical protein KY475_00835 [Planctomycetes bacterium]|nr:hypothetical protein [Planctomycetota bacterium]
MSSVEPSHPDPNYENPQVRLFLDRASAVVAQCGGVNAKSRLLLGKLAEELGLTREEAEPAIRTLLLGSEDFGPPKRGAGRPQPPPLPKRPPPPIRAASGAIDAVVIDDDAVLQNFIDQAAFVLARHGGLNAKSRVVLEQLARSMGVTPPEMDAALKMLHEAETAVEVLPEPAPPPPPPPTAFSPPDDLNPWAEPPADASAPPPESEPPASPPPPPKPRPQEVYRTYLHKAIDDLQRPRINPRRERRLVEQGTNKLGLSPALARHILCEVARERNVAVASRADDPEQPQHPEQTAEFLRRARAIIAEQRGVTLAGQIKITAAANELGLSDEERQRAMDLLQEGAAPQSQDQIRRQELLAAFRESLPSAIDALPRKIITPDVVAELVERGGDLHGVERDDAERAVRDVAAARGVRFISQRSAVEHLTRRVSERMAGSPVLHDLDRKRMFAEGAQWGLAGADVEAVVHEQVEINRQAHAARRRRAGMFAALAGAALFALAASGGAWVLLRSMSSSPATPGDATEVATAGEGGASPEAAPPPADHWWDVDLSVAMARAETELPSLRFALEQVRSHSADTRAQAYAKLVAGLPRTIDSRTASAVHKEILTGCYALDPSDKAAARLRERLLEKIPASTDPLPPDDRLFREAYAAAQIAASAITRDSVSETRSDEMLRSLARIVGMSVDPEWQEAELYRQSMAALTETLYRLVINAAPSQPLAVHALHAFLAGEARRWLDISAWERLDAQFLQAVLPVAEDAWGEYREVILRVVNSADPATVLQAVEILERVRDESLRYFLATALSRRIGQARAGPPPEEVAEAVRERFGAKVTSADRAEDAVRRFSGEADEAIARISAGPDETLQLLEETARLARLAAMGCALSQGELGRAAFDELAEAESISLEKISAEASSPPRASSDAVTEARERVVSRYVESLGRSSHPVPRTGFLRGIAENAPHLNELEPEQGEVIAEYLLAPKSNEEREAIAGFIPQVAKWKAVRLAMADLVADTPVRQDLVQDVVGLALGGAPEIAAEDNWRKQLRRALMRSALERGFAAPSSHPHDAAQEEILASYQSQAQTLGVPAAAYSSATSPAAVLEAMIQHTAARLSGAGDEDDRRFLTSIPHRLQVAEYLGDNDLRRLALLERVWLRLLAIDVAESHTDRAADAGAIIQSIHEADSAAPNVLVQARSGQAALVRMWRLRVE